MFIYVSQGMVESKDLLTQADKAIGDGDHGVGMARGFHTVRQKLEGGAFSTLDELLKAVGMALLTSVGGAAGAVFGTFFRGGTSWTLPGPFREKGLGHSNKTGGRVRRHRPQPRLLWGGLPTVPRTDPVLLSRRTYVFCIAGMHASRSDSPSGI